MKQYRIGEYAKYLGVTPDFLKHYEEMGIIHSSRNESGYRYYSFLTTVELVESVRLRNYGLSLREIREIIHEHSSDNARMDQLFSEKLELLRQEIQLNEALTEEYIRFLRWRETLKDRDWDWEIRRSSPLCFLPHTDGDEFLKDARIYEILNQWMSYTPIVKSTMKIGPGNQITWGFSAEERIIRQLGIPVNDVVELLPPRRTFYGNFRSAILWRDEETKENADHPAFRVLRSMRMESDDTYYRVMLGPADWKQGLSYHYGYYAIPLKE